MRPPARLPRATAIVLAGGRSSRFGSDKLAAELRGRPLLAHAVAAAAAVGTEVILLVPPVGEPPGLPPAEAAVSRVVRDPEPFGGPLVATLAGLERAAEPFVLVVAGDMPGLSVPVLELLLRRLESDPGAEAVALLHRGRRQPLPLALRVGLATPTARRLIADGERRMLSLPAALRALDLDEAEWRALDPEAATLVDVDLPADLPG